MTKINVFKTSTFQVRFFIVFGGLFTLVGLILLIKAIISGFNIKFQYGDWNSVFYTLQGIIFLTMGIRNLYIRKYYIEWDDNELRFLLPDSKKLETITLLDIYSVNIRLFEIELKLKDRTRLIGLSNLQFEDLRKIKDKFEDINKIINNSIYDNTDAM